jgi:hypothetical protein
VNVAAYTPLGEGLWGLLIAILLAVSAIVCWWWRAGIRIATPRSGTGCASCAIVVAFVVTITAAFPPMRRAAEWRNAATGEPIAANDAREFDRSLFGYFPTHRWIGTVGMEEPYEPTCVLTIPEYGTYRCQKYRWLIDWVYVTGQALLLGLVIVAFWGCIRREPRLPSGNQPQDNLRMGCQGTPRRCLPQARQTHSPVAHARPRHPF